MYELYLAQVERETLQHPTIPRMTSHKNQLPPMSSSTYLEMTKDLNHIGYAKLKVWSRSFWPIFKGRRIEQTKLLFIVKVLRRSNNLISKTWNFYNSFYLWKYPSESIFSYILTRNFDHYGGLQPKLPEAHLQLFRPSVIRGPWLETVIRLSSDIMTGHFLSKLHDSRKSRENVVMQSLGQYIYSNGSKICLDYFECSYIQL